MGKNAHKKLPWAEAPILLSLARCKSFAAAAQDLGIDRTTVARRLEKLESQLRTRLFERLSGQLELTQDGRRILSVIERAEQEMGQLQSDEDERRFAHGKVRISLSQHVLSAFAPQFNEFIAAHPAIFLELTTADRFVDLFKYEADIILRIGKTLPDALHNIDLGAVHFGLYRRADQSGPVPDIWVRSGKTAPPGPLQSVHPDATAIAAIDGVLPTRDMILTGSGAGILPRFLGDSDARLASCPPAFPVDKYRMSISCLPEQRNLHRIRIVMKNLSAVLAKTLKEYDDE
jgi:DNA-binding transcriptional LysR family regulator